MEKITGQVSQIIYTHPQNGFSVAIIQEKDKTKSTVIIGFLSMLQVGENIICEGSWKMHPTHSMQFEVEHFESMDPSDVLGIQRYLGSGLIKGIGPTFAQKIVDTFGAETLQVIDLEPEKLSQIPGIGNKKLHKIIQCWKEQKSIRKVMIFLKTYGVSTAYAQKIYKKFGDNSIERVSKAPYELAKEVSGIGFKMADKIALELGFSLDCPERIQAGITYILWELMGSGHTCYVLENLVDLATSILNVDHLLLYDQTTYLVEHGILKKRGEMIWLAKLYLQEESIAYELFHLSRSPSSIRKIEISIAIDWVQNILNICLENKQIIALSKAVLEKVHIITGGPGTGKSTITNALLTIMQKVTSKILLAAPTGRAAKRLSQITKKKALTIHAALEFDPIHGTFKKNKENPLLYDLLIVDEASMIDTHLMYDLLQAIPSTAKLVLLGDIDQLPSVGAGNVLKDLIASEKISVTKLTEIFRQAKNSKIIVNAHRVNQGEFPFLTQAAWCDFHFYEKNTPEEIQEKIVNLVSQEIPFQKNMNPMKDIQVLSPMRKGIIGIEAFNEVLQNKLNPCRAPFILANKKFHLHDKVMQIRNNYQKKIYNGDIGYIIQIDTNEQELFVDFIDKIVCYDFSELDEIVLAYAVSVHKYQGSECPCIVIPIHTSHFKLLHRNLLYTAITRGKKYVVLVGSKKAIAIAVKNNEVQLRHTGLKDAILNFYSQKT